ncbi:MAG: ATPase [Alphaproteobacteria bacterium]|nr:ATPase [Alphaproteobacteria bacterium]
MSASSGNGHGHGPDPAELARKISAQAVYDRPLAKRFYKSVSLQDQSGGFGLALDERPVKTPLKKALRMPSRRLGEAVVREWERQEEHIDPGSMMLTKLCNTALDRVGDDRSRIIDEIVDYANADLLCYRAEGPAKLVARQCKHWDPVLKWAAEDLGARFSMTTGITHQSQSDACLTAFRRFVEDLNDFAMAGYHNAMTITGSAVLAAAAQRQHLPAEEVWSLAHVDEDWQIEQWGPDEEEAERRSGRRAEFQGIIEFLMLLD